MKEITYIFSIYKKCYLFHALQNSINRSMQCFFAFWLKIELKTLTLNLSWVWMSFEYKLPNCLLLVLQGNIQKHHRLVTWSENGKKFFVIQSFVLTSCFYQVDHNSNGNTFSLLLMTQNFKFLFFAITNAKIKQTKNIFCFHAYKP